MPPYKECSNYDDCGRSNGTIKVNLDGKNIAETFDERGILHESLDEKTKLIDFKFHHGSKIQFNLTASIRPGNNDGVMLSYGAAIKFYSFKIDQCFSKCE